MQASEIAAIVGSRQRRNLSGHAGFGTHAPRRRFPALAGRCPRRCRGQTFACFAGGYAGAGRGGFQPAGAGCCGPAGRVQGREPLSRSSLVVPGEAQDVTITHVLGDAPSEVHVWLSLKHATPISVLTTSNEQHWFVDGESISLL